MGDGARSDLESALAIFRLIDDRANEANVLLSLGKLKNTLGDNDGAQTDLENALTIFRVVKDHTNEADCLTTLAKTKAELGYIESSLGSLQIVGEMSTLQLLSELKLKIGDDEGAIADMDAVLDM